MRIVDPRDVYILRALKNGRGGNQSPKRTQWLIAEYLSDQLDRDPWDRHQISRALSRLADRDLADRAPPENSGLYRLTMLGAAALSRYERTGDNEFSIPELTQEPGFDREAFFDDDRPEYSD